MDTIKDIAIYGAGGLGREVAAALDELLPENEGYRFIGFFDDGRSINEPIDHWGICHGGINELNTWPKPLYIALCFGAPRTISNVHKKIMNPVVKFPNLINRDFRITDPSTFNIGEGNIIMGGCKVTTEVTLGNFNLLNGDVILGHDVTIGDYNVLMPGCRLSGEVKMGRGNLIGAMAFVKQQLKIGDGVTLSPLSALLTKPKDKTIYMGNPAKIFRY